MKTQLARLSPHQNAKVFGVLTALGSLIFVLPVSLLFVAFGPAERRFPTGMLLAAPIFYLVFGYVATLIGCAVYNVMFRFIGGIEFESRDVRG